MDKKSRSGIQIRDEHPGSYFRELRNNFLGLNILKFVDAGPDLGSGIFLTLDPGWKNSDPGLKSRIHNTGFALVVRQS
jgi:hypothetical protein